MNALAMPLLLHSMLYESKYKIREKLRQKEKENGNGNGKGEANRTQLLMALSVRFLGTLVASGEVLTLVHLYMGFT